LSDSVKVGGFWLGVGASMSARLGGGWTLRPRALVGFLVAHSSDSVSGDGLDIAGSDDVTHTTPFVALVDFGLERTIGASRVSLALSAFYLPVPGAPASTHGTITATNGGATSNAIAGERAYGPILAWGPELTLAWDASR
jgi:hypothetical protein